MAKNNNLSDFLTDVANSIRTKKGITGNIAAQNFSDEILSIETGAGSGSAINNINYVKYMDSYIDVSTEYDFHGDGANPVTLPVNYANRFSFPWINGQQYRISIVEAQTSGGGMVTVYAYNSSTNTLSDALVSAGYDAPNRSVEWTCNGAYDMITIYNGTGGGSACNWQYIKVEINVEGYYAVGTAQSTIPLNIANGYAKVKQLKDYAVAGGTLYENSATYQVEPMWSFTPTTSAQFIRPAVGKEGWFGRNTCIHIEALGNWAGTLGQLKESTTATTGTEINTQLFKITPKLTTTTSGYLSGNRDGTVVNYRVRDWAGTISASKGTTSATTGTPIDTQLFTITPTATTSTSGWLSGSKTGTAITYKVKDGSATTPTSSITATPSGPTWNSTTSKYDITFSGSKSITPTVSAGWVSAGTAGTVSASGTKSLDKSTSTVSGTVTNATATTTVSPGEVTISQNTAAVTGKTRISATPTTSTNNINTYYIALKAKAAANASGETSAISGTGKTTLTTTAGYEPGATYTPENDNISATGTATAKTREKESSQYYIPIPSGSATGVAGSLSNTSFTQDTTNKKKFNITTTVSAPAPSVSTGYIVSGAGSAGSSVNRTTSITITDAQAKDALGAALSPTYSSSAPSGGEQLVAYDPTGSADSYIYSSSGLYLSPNSYIKLNKPLQLTLPTSTSTSSSGTSKLTITPGTSNKYINIARGFNNTAGYYTIQGSSNLTAANIKSGVSIFGVTGTYTGSSGSNSSIVQITQAAYNALTTKDPNIIYLIIG